MIGDPHPDCTLGFSVNMGWRGFDVSATMNGAFGNQIMKSYRSFADYPKNNFTSDILDRWHGAGTSTRWPRLTSGTSTNWQFVSDLYVENGDFLRMHGHRVSTSAFTPLQECIWLVLTLNSNSNENKTYHICSCYVADCRQL